MARLNKNSKLGWDMIKILKGKNLNLFSFFFFPPTPLSIYISVRAIWRKQLFYLLTRPLKRFERLLREHHIVKLCSGVSSPVALNWEERQREAFITGSVKQEASEQRLRAHLGRLCRAESPWQALECTPGPSAP